MQIDNLKTLIDALRTGHGPYEITGTPVAVVPDGCRIETLDDYRERPRRAETLVIADSCQAFLDYWARFATAASVCFFSATDGARAIIDYHAPTTPDWCQHRLRYACPIDPRWELWLANNDKPMGQEQFAEWIEDQAACIVDPESADMREISLSLQANTKVAYRSARRLDNGEVQLSYHEEIEGKGGRNGQLEIPQLITLSLPVFRGGIPQLMHARFRYRIVDGQLSLRYKILEIERVTDDAYNQVGAMLEKGVKASGKGTYIAGRPGK